MTEPVTVREQDLAAISQELAHMGITPERTHGRDYDRTDDFGPSR